MSNLCVVYIIPVLLCAWETLLPSLLVGLEFQGWFLQRMKVLLVIPTEEEGQDGDPCRG